MSGGKQKQRGAYTIIEVMIVLAVSGVMFVIASTFISGKQASTAFTQGTNEMVARLQQVITEAENGQVSDVAYSCTTASAPLKYNSSSNATRGTQDACLFIGKFVKFNDGYDPTKYRVVTLAIPSTATDFSHSQLTPLNKLNDANPSGAVDITKHYSIPQSLKATVKVTILPASPMSTGISTGGFGIVQTLQGEQSANPFELIYDPTVFPGADIDGSISTLNPTQISVATICLTDGSRYANIIVGSTNGGGIAVRKEVVSSCN